MREANEQHFIDHLSKIQSGGFYGWIDEKEIMRVENGKFVLTQQQFVKVLSITSKKFTKKYVKMPSIIRVKKK
jgi:hypothetical protein